jgi:hypothetical protein
MVSREEEGEWRCRPGRPRVAGYVIYIYRGAVSEAACYEHLAIEDT